MQTFSITSEKDPNYLSVIHRLKLATITGNKGSDPNHKCIGTSCHPRSEVDLIKSGHLPYNINRVSYNVYICDYGRIHICNEDVCKLYGSTPTLTCPISGLQMASIVSNYNKDDSRTWYNKQTQSVDASSGNTAIVKKRKKNPVHTSETTIKNVCETVISNLLYSTARREYNQAMEIKYAEEAKLAMNTYALSRKTKLSQMAYKTDLYRINAYYMNKYAPLAEMKLDINVIKYYSEIIWQVWNICVKYHIHPNQRILNDNGDEIKNRLTPEVVVLGVLYSLRQGLSVGDGIHVLPKDEFLQQHLPLVNNYTLFSIDKTKVTRGLNILLQSYNNAVSLGVDTTQLLLDVTRLPKKE